MANVHLRCAVFAGAGSEIGSACSLGRQCCVPRGTGCGSATTCWGRLDEWARARIFEQFQALFLDELVEAGCIDSHTRRFKRPNSPIAAAQTPTVAVILGYARGGRGTSDTEHLPARSPTGAAPAAEPSKQPDP